jgi:thiamine-monophosphate kinase
VPRLSDLGEFPLIARLAALLPRPSARVKIPIGDDAAAVVPPAGELLVATVDMLVEDVDFTAGTPAELVGRKAIAVNLSDLAAMGARPESLLVALAAPAFTDVAWVEALYRGIASIAREHGADVIGGDLSSAITRAISVTALGRAAAPVKRAGAADGDLVCVTGSLGDAAAGLESIARGANLSDPLVRRQLDPSPRVAAGLALAGIARAMIDVSDGLLADLGHLCDAAGLGARLEVAKLPLSAALKASRSDPMRCALTGGEDFELLVAVRPADEARARAAVEATGIPLATIGVFTRASGTALVKPDGTLLPPPEREGWKHFQAR